MKLRQTLLSMQSLALLFLLGAAGCLDNQKKESFLPEVTPETPEERREILDELISEGDQALEERSKVLTRPEKGWATRSPT